MESTEPPPPSPPAARAPRRPVSRRSRWIGSVVAVLVLAALGTVVPATTVTVQPQVSGGLTRVRFEEGRMVRKGELLATIAPEPFQMALTQATSARALNRQASAIALIQALGGGWQVQ